MKYRNRLAAAVGVALLVCLAGDTSAQRRPPLDTRGLATGPYSRMSAKLERTFMRVDVVRVDLRFDEPTRREIEKVARGNRYSAARADRIAEAVIGAERAQAQVTFLRDVDLGMYLDGIRDDLQRAENAGMIADRSRRRWTAEPRRTLAFLEDRGFREGDRLYYDIRGTTVRTTIVDEEGRMLGDRYDRADDLPRTILAGYMAPGSNFREILVRPLFRN